MTRHIEFRNSALRDRHAFYFVSYYMCPLCVASIEAVNEYCNTSDRIALPEQIRRAGNLPLLITKNVIPYG